MAKFRTSTRKQAEKILAEDIAHAAALNADQDAEFEAWNRANADWCEQNDMPTAKQIDGRFA